MTEEGACTKRGVPTGCRGTGVSLLLIVVACLLVYAQTVRMDFVYDDIVALKERPAGWSVKSLGQAFTGSVMQGVGKKSPYYRPLQVVALDLERAVWGANPAGFHATSTLFHCIASFLVFFLARRVLSSSGAATVGALLFALHPLQAEAVTWINARGDILCAIFTLTALLAFIRYLEEGVKTGLFWSLTLFSAALLTKEMAITYPLLLALYMYFRRGGWDRLWPLSLHLIPLALYLGVRYSVLPSQVWDPVPLSWRLATGVGLVVRYLQNLLFPVDLRIFYDLPVQKVVLSTSVILPLLVLVPAVIVTGVALGKRRISGFGFAWFFTAILPVSGFLALLQPSLMADRYMYLPIIGPAIAAGACFCVLEERRGKAAFWVAGALCLCLGGLALVRTLPWRDQATYMRSVIADAPLTVFGHYYQGSIFLDQGRLDEAFTAFNRSLELNPDLPETHFSLGIVYIRKGFLPEAEAEFLTSTRLDPLFWKGYTNLGAVYLQEQRRDQAIAAFRRALELNPADGFASDNLQRAYSITPAPVGETRRSVETDKKSRL